MYIKSMVLKNFKGLIDTHEFVFKQGLNYLLGDNNCGKSTVFEALNFVVSGKSVVPGDFASNGRKGHTSVAIVVSGSDLGLALEDEKFALLKPFLHTDADGDLVLKVERSDQVRTVTQKGKEVHLDETKITFWSVERGQFENATGIDARFKSFLELSPIWANTDPSDHSDAATTKTLGKLLSRHSVHFLQSKIWEAFSGAHKAAFGDGKDSFATLTAEVAGDVEKLVQEQFGDASVRLHFDLPDAATFTRSARLMVKDGNSETEVKFKGTGMQRAIALALIQVYAASVIGAGGGQPLLLMLDEPETWLHPRAQIKLAAALSKIAEAEQVFLITHSPYMLRSFALDSHQLLVFEGHPGMIAISYPESLGVVDPGRPSWGEINWTAFGVPSQDLHSELFGRVSQMALEHEGGNFITTKATDAFLQKRGVLGDRTWTKDGGAVEEGVTLPYIVRNTLNHPENPLATTPTQDELAESIRVLWGVVNELNHESLAFDSSTGSEDGE